MERTRSDATGPVGDPDALIARIGEVLERIEADFHILIEVERDQRRLLDLIAKKLS